MKSVKYNIYRSVWNKTYYSTVKKCSQDLIDDIHSIILVDVSTRIDWNIDKMSIDKIEKVDFYE